MSIDPASLIVSLAALATAAGGIWSSRAGRKDSAEQQQVARKMNDRDVAWKARGEIITDLRAENEHKQAVVERERARAEAAQSQLDDLRDLVDTHEPWDLARRAQQPDSPPPPPLRFPRPRRPAD